MTFQDTVKAEYQQRLHTLQKDLPPFVTDFFRSLGDYTAIKTRVGYAYDLKIFFDYLAKEAVPKPTIEITMDDLAQLTVLDIEIFMSYLSYYHNNAEAIVQNESLGKARKLAAVRKMFKYFYRRGKVTANPAELVGFPKLREKPIITLEPDEVGRLLDQAESGEALTDHQKRYHAQTKVRDVALLTLLLGTGMRVSECVGINIQDIDFDVHGVKVTRKGGDEVILYFGNEVAEALQDYMVERLEIAVVKPDHRDALFLSLQDRRITDRAVQNLVKKYAAVTTPLKTITPHKLRSTFGTQLYQETGDIYLVANVLGHADVNTTRKHYAKMDETRRRNAANAVKLRKE